MTPPLAAVSPACAVRYTHQTPCTVKAHTHIRSRAGHISGTFAPEHISGPFCQRAAKNSGGRTLLRDVRGCLHWASPQGVWQPEGVSSDVREDGVRVSPRRHAELFHVRRGRDNRDRGLLIFVLCAEGVPGDQV